MKNQKLGMLSILVVFFSGLLLTFGVIYMVSPYIQDGAVGAIEIVGIAIAIVSVYLVFVVIPVTDRVMELNW